MTQDVSADFKNKLSQEYPVFVKHNKIITNHYAMVHEMKGNHNEETESSPLTSTKTCVTQHPVVVHYKRNVQDEDNEEAPGCLSYVVIVDDRTHNASSVFAILQQFIPLLKRNLPSIRHIRYLTDSLIARWGYQDLHANLRQFGMVLGVGIRFSKTTTYKLG